MADFPQTVAILGARHVTSLPSFGIREALVITAAKYADADAGDVRVLWALAAVVGCCCGVGAKAGSTLARDGYDVLKYGERVYSYLREQGATSVDVANAGNELLAALADALMPGKQEVDAAEGF